MGIYIYIILIISSCSYGKYTSEGETISLIGDLSSLGDNDKGFIGGLCGPCEEHGDCIGKKNLCLSNKKEKFCGKECYTERDCPSGFVCLEVFKTKDSTWLQCVPQSRSCAQDSSENENEKTGCNPPCGSGYVCKNGRCVKEESPSSPFNPSSGDIEHKALDLTNHERATHPEESCGGRPLKFNQKAADVARKHSQYMASIGRLTHYDASGPVNRRIAAVGLRFVAENCGRAMMRDELSSVKAIIRGFMSEPVGYGHRAALMTCMATEVGIGIVKDQRGTLWLTMDFVIP